MKSLYTTLVCILSFLTASVSAQTYNLTVAQDGSGNYSTVQAAINAAPANSATPYLIFVKNGKYREKVTIPSNKPNIQLIGESVAKVVITWDDYSNRMVTCNTVTGTQNSATFTVNANDFVAINITFENSHEYGTPDNNGQQAVAILVNADRAAFKNCRFIGMQDTMYLKGSGTPRVYFKNCYIDGITDFIFGSSIALFDSCVVYAKTRAGITSSWVTAPNTPAGQAYGYVFRDARLPMNNGTTTYYLSRPWPSPSEAGTNQKCVFLAPKLSSHIAPAGWATWNSSTITGNLYYGEYASRFFNGTLVDVSQRVNWSYQLSQADSAAYTMTNVLTANGTLTPWDPCSVFSGFCTSNPTDIAVSNFKATKGSTSAQLDWNISWPLTGIQYNLYRSSDNLNFTQVYSTTATNDTAINFTYTDNTVPASGSTYYYYIAASRAGYTTHITDTITVSNAPAITAVYSDGLNLCGFNQVIGSPSASQTYTIAATNLTDNITITPPANYEVSSNNTTWSTNASPLTVTQSSGTVGTTTIYIRLNAAAAGSYSGNIVNISTGATSISIPVSGTAINAPTINSTVLQQWPLSANANEDPAVRSAYIAVGSAPALNKFTVSNGTTVAAVPAYSATYGMAFGATTNGDGTWTTTVGGPGGNLSRVNYVQFAVTASGRTVRVDSVVLSAAFYGTNSNTKFGVVYSKTAFTTADSTEVTGGIDQSGTAVTASFASPTTLANQTTGISNTYRLAINGTTGVTLTDGQTLTIRVYYACGSTSPGRYGLMKNFIVKGEALSALPVSLLQFTGTSAAGVNTLHWKTANQENTASFTIERSATATDFKPVGSVNALNNVSSYSFADAQPVTGANYYQLKMIDRDGSYRYSAVIVLNAINQKSVTVFPNPAKEVITVSHDKAGTLALIEVFTADGRKIVSNKVTTGESVSTINVAGLVKGVYLLVYSDGNNKSSTKLMKD